MPLQILTSLSISWRNLIEYNLGWVKIDDKDIETDDELVSNQLPDVFNITSLYGQKLSDKFAYLRLGEYRTTIIDNFNRPGLFDIGVGATWNAHCLIWWWSFTPLNYNFVFKFGGITF